MTLSFYGPILGEFKGCTAFVPPSMVNSFCGFDFSCHLCPKEKQTGCRVGFFLHENNI